MLSVKRGIMNLIAAMKMALRCDEVLIAEIKQIEEMAKRKNVMELDGAWIVPIIAYPVSSGAFIRVRNVEIIAEPVVGEVLLIDVNETSIDDMVSTITNAVDNYDDIDAWLHACTHLGAFIAKLKDVDYGGVLLWTVLAVPR